MRLNQKAIDEFKKIHLQEFGESLSDGEAREIAERFINVMEIICRPIPGVDFPIDEDKKSLARTPPGAFWPILNHQLKWEVERLIII